MQMTRLDVMVSADRAGAAGRSGGLLRRQAHLGRVLRRQRHPPTADRRGLVLPGRDHGVGISGDLAHPSRCGKALRAKRKP
jgi:hypothetical protein